MTIIEHNTREADIRVSSDELVIMNNALNEVCHGIAVPEFETRIGHPLERVQELLNAIGNLIDRMER